MDRLEWIFTILGIVTGSDIQILVSDRRTHYFLIVVTSLDTAQEILQTDAQCSTFRQPHGKSLTYHIRKHEQIHFFTYLAMVAFFGFFQHCQIFIQHLFLWESNTINTRHLFAVFLPSPISTGYRKQLNSFDRCSRHQVRTTAKVSKRTLCISSNVTIFQFGNQFTFICLTSFSKFLQSVFFGNTFTHQSLFLCCQFSHLRFDNGQIRVLNGSFSRIYIIIETIFDSRTDTKLNTRIKFLQCFCQQVSTCMPKSMFTLFIFPFIKNKVCIFIDRTWQVNSLAIHTASQNILRQAWTDTFCNLQTCYSFVVFTNRAVGECYLYHNYYV